VLLLGIRTPAEGHLQAILTDSFSPIYLQSTQKTHWFSKSPRYITWFWGFRSHIKVRQRNSWDRLEDGGGQG